MGCICPKEKIKTVKPKRLSNESSEGYVTPREKLPLLEGGFLDEKDSVNKRTSSVKFHISSMIRQQNGTFHQEYKILRTLGSGSYGTVYKVMNKATGSIRAMKAIKKSCFKNKEDKKDKKEEKSLIIKEIEILAEISHPHVVKIFEFFEDKINIYIIMEFSHEGDLNSKIHRLDEDITEEHVSIIMKQLLSAVCYIHSNNILHGDIKPENILVERFNISAQKLDICIKLCDFGTSNKIRKEENLKELVGSPYFVAPEVLNKSYNHICDLWSCGVVMYFLLSADMPFKGDSHEEIKASILRADYSMNSSFFDTVSLEAKDLIEKLLVKDPSKRLNAEEALKHPWFKQSTKNNSNLIIDPNEANSLIKKMQNFCSRDKFQHATLAFIIHFIDTTEEIDRLNKVFKSMNSKTDGKLSFKELKQGLENIKGEMLSENEITNIFDNLDTDLSGFIDYEEFLRATIDYNLILSEKNLQAAFNNFDINRDGKIDREELKRVFSSENIDYFDELIKKIDENNDGEIDFEEFSHLMGSLLQNLLIQNESIKSIVSIPSKENDVPKTQRSKDRKKTFFTVKNIIQLDPNYSKLNSSLIPSVKEVKDNSTLAQPARFRSKEASSGAYKNEFDDSQSQSLKPLLKHDNGEKIVDFLKVCSSGSNGEISGDMGGDDGAHLQVQVNKSEKGDIVESGKKEHHKTPSAFKEKSNKNSSILEVDNMAEKTAQPLLLLKLQSPKSPLKGNLKTNRKFSDLV